MDGSTEDPVDGRIDRLLRHTDVIDGCDEVGGNSIQEPQTSSVTYFVPKFATSCSDALERPRCLMDRGRGSRRSPGTPVSPKQIACQDRKKKKSRSSSRSSELSRSPKPKLNNRESGDRNLKP